MSVKNLNCLPRKSTEIQVDMSVKAHMATGFGIYTFPRQNKWPTPTESSSVTRFSRENNHSHDKSVKFSFLVSGEKIFRQ
jgi:hypothetical protein